MAYHPNSSLRSTSILQPVDCGRLESFLETLVYEVSALVHKFATTNLTPRRGLSPYASVMGVHYWGALPLPENLL